MLEVEIDHIADQIDLARERDRQGIRQLDTGWVRKATDSARHKREEVAALKLWINQSTDRKKDAIIDILKEEYDADDWRGIEEDAEEKLNSEA